MSTKSELSMTAWLVTVAWFTHVNVAVNDVAVTLM